VLPALLPLMSPVALSPPPPPPLLLLLPLLLQLPVLVLQLPGVVVESSRAAESSRAPGLNRSRLFRTLASSYGTTKTTSRAYAAGKLILSEDSVTSALLRSPKWVGSTSVTQRSQVKDQSNSSGFCR
jgi:hypothetical protein